MAKFREEARPAKSKMTVMVFQLEGSDETIQEGLRRVSESVQGIIRPAAKPLLKSVEANTGAEGQGPQEDQGGGIHGAEQVQDEVENFDGEGDDSLRPPKRERSEKPVQYQSSIESNLKSASVSLEDFAKEKKAGDGATRRTLVVAMWLRDHAGIAEFTADHIYTCFKWVKWTNTPDHPRQFLRNMKSRDHCFDTGTKPAHVKLNHRGEKLIEEEVAKSS